MDGKRIEHQPIQVVHQSVHVNHQNRHHRATEARSNFTCHIGRPSEHFDASLQPFIHIVLLPTIVIRPFNVAGVAQNPAQRSHHNAQPLDVHGDLQEANVRRQTRHRQPAVEHPVVAARHHDAHHAGADNQPRDPREPALASRHQLAICVQRSRLYVIWSTLPDGVDRLDCRIDGGDKALLSSSVGGGLQQRREMSRLRAEHHDLVEQQIYVGAQPDDVMAGRIDGDGGEEDAHQVRVRTPDVWTPRGGGTVQVEWNESECLE